MSKLTQPIISKSPFAKSPSTVPSKSPFAKAPSKATNEKAPKEIPFHSNASELRSADYKRRVL